MAERRTWTWLVLAMLFGLFAGTPAFAQDPQDGSGSGTEDGSGSSVVEEAGEGPLKPKKGKIRMRVEPLADGLTRAEGWSVVRVKVANGAGSQSARVEIRERVDDGESIPYSRDIELPNGTVKEVDLYYRPNWSRSEREVILSPTQARPMSFRFMTQSVSADTVTVGMIGDEHYGLPVVQQTWMRPVPGKVARPYADSERPVRMGLIPLTNMPERSMGYGSMDWVVWPEANPSKVSPEQVDALRAWVADGGHLVVTVSDKWQLVNNSKLADVLPVKLSGVDDGDAAKLIAALSATGGGDSGWWGNEGYQLPTIAPQPPTPIATATVRDEPGRWAASIVDLDDGRPGWVIGTYGLGTVTVVTASPGLTPLSKQVSREQLWRRLLWLPPPGETGTRWLSNGLAGAEDPTDIGPALGIALRMHDHRFDSPWKAVQDYGYGFGYGDYGWEAELRTSLSDMPGVAPLPLSWLIAFSVCYLLAIGPIDYAVLRLLGKQPWTWLTFPATIALFSAAALLGTALIKGNQAVVQRLEVVDILPGTDLWRGDTFLGVFTTRKTTVHVRGGEVDSLVQPLEERGYMKDMHITAAEGPGVLRYRAETWTLAYANSRWVGPGRGTITVTPGDGAPVVTSSLPWDLEDAELRAGGKTVALGTLRAGETRQVRWDIDDGYGLPSEEPVVKHLQRYPDKGRGHLDVSGWGVVLGIVRRPVENLSIEGLAPESEATTLIRAPFAMPTDLERYGAGPFADIQQTVFDGVTP